MMNTSPPTTISAFSISSSQRSFELNEGDGFSTSLLIVPTPSEPLTVHWTFVGTSGHFAPTSGSVLVGAGTNSVTISSNSIADNLYNSDLVYSLVITSVSDTRYEGDTIPLTLKNIDAMPSLSINSVTGDGADPTMDFTVTLSAASGVDTAFLVTTYDGSATATVDFTAVSSQLFTIPAGQTTIPVPITLINPFINGADRVFTVVISSPVNATITSATGTGTLHETSSVPALSFTSPAASSYINIANETSFAIAGTCSLPSTTVSITGPNGFSDSTTCSGGGTFSKSIDAHLVTDGIGLTFTVTQTDTHGNSGSASLVLNKDAQAPDPFTITGATGGSDVTANGYLTSGVTLTANWNASTGASTYDVTIRNAADNADVCAIQNTALTLYMFASCVLSNATTYQIRVVAKDTAGNSTAATNGPFAFVVNNDAPTISSFARQSGQTTPINVLPVAFTLVFSEAIDPTTFAAGDISNTGTATSVTWTVGTADNITWTISATVVGGVGTLIPQLAAGAIADIAGNTNAATATSSNSVLYTNLGAFSISGVTGGTDNTADATLSNGVLATVAWAASANAASYNVTVYEDDGTTVKCAQQNTASTNYNFSSCTLTHDEYYRAKVTSVDSGSTEWNATNSTYRFYVAPAVVLQAVANRTFDSTGGAIAVGATWSVDLADVETGSPSDAGMTYSCEFVSGITATVSGANCNTLSGFTYNASFTSNGQFTYVPVTAASDHSYSFKLTGTDGVTTDSIVVWVNVRSAYKSDATLMIDYQAAFATGKALGSNSPLTTTWFNGAATGSSYNGSLASGVFTSGWSGDGTALTNPFRLVFDSSSSDRVSSGTGLNSKATMMFSSWIKSAGVGSGNSGYVFGTAGPDANGWLLTQTTDGTLDLKLGASSSISYQQAVLNLNPVVYLQLEETAGTVAADSSPSVNNATITNPGSVTLNQSGGYGGSRGYYSSGSGYLALGTNVDVSGSYTAMAWIKMPLPLNGAWKTLFRASISHHQLLFQDTNNHLGAYNGSSFVNSGFDPATLSAGWHHFVIVGAAATASGYTAGNSYFYVDGTLRGSIAHKSNQNIYAIGNYQGGGQPLYNFDDPAIFQSALTAAQIADLYAKTQYCSIAQTAADWIHVGGLFDGTNLKFYRNGFLKCQLTPTVGISGSTQPFTIGARSDGSQAWSGAIGQLQVYDSGSGSDIISNYTSDKHTYRTMTSLPSTVLNTASDWTLNGGAALSGGALTITNNVGGEAKSAFYNNQIDITEPFTVVFTYTAGGDKAADGVTFVVQNSSKTALGGNGGWLGYNGISPSVAYQINIWNGRPFGSYVATNGSIGTYVSSAPVMVNSGNPIVVTLQYDPVAQTLVETLSETNTAHTYTKTWTGISFETTLGSAEAWVGFTGATGGSYATQTISGFSLTYN